MALVAIDVGGTNVRFAVVGASGLGDVRSMLCAACHRPGRKTRALRRW